MRGGRCCRRACPRSSEPTTVPMIAMNGKSATGQWPGAGCDAERRLYSLATPGRMNVKVNGFCVSTATASIRTAISRMCAQVSLLSSIASNSSSDVSCGFAREPRRQAVDDGGIADHHQPHAEEHPAVHRHALEHVAVVLGAQEHRDVQKHAGGDRRDTQPESPRMPEPGRRAHSGEISWKPRPITSEARSPTTTRRARAGAAACPAAPSSAPGQRPAARGGAAAPAGARSALRRSPRRCLLPRRVRRARRRPRLPSLSSGVPSTMCARIARCSGS